MRIKISPIRLPGSKDLNFALNVFKNSPSFWLGLFSFSTLVVSLLWVPPYRSLDRRIQLPSYQLERFSFGFQEVLADTLWINSIQFFDMCEAENMNQICNNKTWLYDTLNTITGLSPRFRAAYFRGALALGILVLDPDGAGRIYDKAVAQFPNDWQILYYAGYHFLYEVHDPKKAAGYLERAAAHGAPPWVYSLAGRLYLESGNPKLARELLSRMIQSEQDPNVIRRMREKIESLDSN